MEANTYFIATGRKAAEEEQNLSEQKKARRDQTARADETRFEERKEEAETLISTTEVWNQAVKMVIEGQVRNPKPDGMPWTDYIMSLFGGNPPKLDLPLALSDPALECHKCVVELTQCITDMTARLTKLQKDRQSLGTKIEKRKASEQKREARNKMKIETFDDKDKKREALKLGQKQLG